MKPTAHTIPRFFTAEPLAGSLVHLGEDAAHHMRVLRLGVGAPVHVLDGAGKRAPGILRAVAKRNATVEVDSIEEVPPPPVMHALVPIAERERMLWLAEKAAELGATSWRPVMWKRSRSVSPRGEGPGFHAKVRARMIAALEQSGNAWLPSTYPDAPLDRALSAVPDGKRIVLDADGARINDVLAHAVEPVIIAIGPEGGLEAGELDALRTAGFEPASLGAMTLRFETAGTAALAHVRARLT